MIGLLLLCVFGPALSLTIHEGLTAQERAKLFPMAGTEVPEYQIIPVYTPKLQKRAIDQRRHIQLKAFGEDINLYLNPIDSILATSETPVFSITKGLNIVRHQNMMNKVVTRMYQDEQQSTTVYVNEIPNENIQLTGIIGANDLYLRPLSEDLIYYVQKKRRSIDNFPQSNSGNFSYHIAYKLPKEPQRMKTFETTFKNSLRSKRSVPDTIYPEIMVIIDYPMFNLMEKNPYYAIAYTLAFFNGVDLKYRSLENPKFRLNIAGIIIATEPNALEYMQQHLHYAPYDLLVQEVLAASEEWLAALETQIPTVNFDVAITLTPKTFCIEQEGTCRRGAIGYAHVGGACLREQWEGGVRRPNSGIVHDMFSFEGVLTTAHELGHLFGINHDGEKNNHYCNPEHGHIMTPSISLSVNATEWSYCSLKELDNFLNRDPTCLYNRPMGGQPLPKFLPGKILSADEQCQKIEGTKAFYVDDSTCLQLQCVNRDNPYEGIARNAAAEGTSCGYRKICLHGHCVHESLIRY